jgi:hypothetical protein
MYPVFSPGGDAETPVLLHVLADSASLNPVWERRAGAGGKAVINKNPESDGARSELFQSGTSPLRFAGGGVSARKTPDLSGGRSSITVFHTVSTSTLS